MKWSIPAKTFLLGEYAAVIDGSALVLTTSPCFTVELVAAEIAKGIHAASPAGLWWSRHSIPNHGLQWHDPYHGQGGLGASSAQFLGAYMASCHLLNLEFNSKAMLDGYYQCAWGGEGLRPSGYDVLAQTKNACVYINRYNKVIESYPWSFKDIGFMLLHSGEKLATHYHLKSMSLPDGVHLLSQIVERAKEAMLSADSERFIGAINDYQERLRNMHLLARHSQQQIDLLKNDKSILAAKGCGALGADVLLIIVAADSVLARKKKFEEEGWMILATTEDLYTGRPLIKNNPEKTLEILS